MRKYVCIFFSMYFVSCVDNNDFNAPNSTCQNQEIIPNATFADIKALYNDEIVKIQDDLIIEGYVISNDQSGNFFGSLHFQNDSTNPSEGLQIDVDLRDSYLFHRVGQKICIKLKGLYLDESNGIYKVGGLFRNAGGTLSVGRLPVSVMNEHIFNSCEAIQNIEAKEVFINELNDDMLNTLIKIQNVEFADEDLLQAYAILEETTDRTLNDCNGHSIILRNSGYSDFQSEILPDGNGSVIGVLGKYKNKYQLTIRDLEDVNFDNERCNSLANTKLIDLDTIRNMYTGSNVAIKGNLKIKGVVISDRSSKNIESNKVIIQDKTAGIEINFGIEHPLNLGDEVEIHLLNTDLKKVNGSLQLTDIPLENIISITQGIVPVSKNLTIEEALSGNYESELVHINAIQFSQLGGAFQGIQYIMDCNSNLEVFIASESTFANEKVNELNGTITGIIRINNSPQLFIRNLNDINFSNEYIDCYANDSSVFISEIADPDNNVDARFVELYNSSNEEINLTGWELRRYTNANTEVSSSINLSGYTINAKSIFIIASNMTEFENVYGFKPDMDGGANGPADSNGDDNLELVNSIGTIIDVFGVPGEDGSGTSHEFEDGKAIRNLEVTQGNPIYDFSEWTIFNDSGNSGTINVSQQAPNDFTPGIR